MYLSHFGLNEKPFKISSDPKFLWLSDKHREALATLTYGILDNKGFLLLTGDVGTGKTTLINTLINSITDQAIVAVVSDPGLSKLEFYNYLANEFKIKGKFTDKATFLFHFRHFLNEAHIQQKKVLLIIDEAQRLEHDLLEDIRLLSNIEQQQIKLLNIFLIGQNDFNDTLLKIENRAIRQRISLNYHINPLLEHETELYIRHRLKMAGGFQDIFDANAIKEIHFYTKGFPRLINILCDHALLTGYVRERQGIGPDIIRECVKELRIMPAKMNYTPEEPSIEIETAPSEINPLKEAKEGAKQVKLHAERSRKTYAKKASPKHSYKWAQITSLLLIAVASIFFGLYIYGSEPSIVKERITAYFQNVHSNLNIQYPPVTQKTAAARIHDQGQASIPKPQPEEPATPITMAIPVETMKEKKQIKPLSLVENTHPAEKNSAGGSAPVPQVVKTPEMEPQSNGANKKPEEQKRMNPEDQAFYSRAMAGHRLPIPFVRNSNDLSTGSYKQLAIVTEILKAFPEATIDIKGYSDSTGTGQYNKNLSQFRANIVKSYFLGNGIEEKRIVSTGMGMVNPLMSNETVEGRKANRRVEIQLRFSQGKEASQ